MHTVRHVHARYPVCATTTGSPPRPSPSRSADPDETSGSGPLGGDRHRSAPGTRLDPLLHHRAHRVEHLAGRHRQGVQLLVDGDLDLQP